MNIKINKNLFSVKYASLLIVFFLLLIASVATLFSEQASAQDKLIQLPESKQTVQVDQNTHFSFELNNIEAGNLTINYPENFYLDEEKFLQENSNNVQNIKTNSEQRQLSVELKANDVKVIYFSGKFSKEGKQKIMIQVGEEKEELTIDVQPATITEQKTLLEESQPVSIDDKNEVEAISPRIALPDFDWNLLNQDGLDLSSFQQVSVNTPVKLTGGIFDKQQREYYMFFGHVGKTNSYNYTTGFSKTGNMLAPLGETTKMPLLSPMMIGVKKSDSSQASTRVFGYDYDYTNTSVSSTNANFDIGEVDPLTGMISKAGITETGSTTHTWITSQYVKKNEIISYGFFEKKVLGSSSKELFYQPVRVHGYVVSEGTGRIRYDVSFYNDDQQANDYALTYGAHMDVGGAHTSSKLFSYGKAGLYFNEVGKTPVDELPARIYFYTNVGYENAIGPSDYNVGNLYESISSSGKKELSKISYWEGIQIQNWLTPIVGYKNPYENWNPVQSVGYQFPLTHPVFALRWNKLHVNSGEVGTESLDLSIEEPAPVLPSVEKEYQNDRGADVRNEIGDTLSFSVRARNRGDMDVWKQVELTDTLPKELELDTTSLILVDQDGKESALDPSIYDKETHKFTAGFYDIAAQSQVEIKYKAKIISGTNPTIVNKFAASNTAGQNANIEVKIPVYEKLDFKLKEEVFHEDGSIADRAEQGETLFYKTTIQNPNSLGNPKYRSFQGMIGVDPQLENIKNMTVKDQTGTEIGQAFYDQPSNQIVYVSGDSVDGVLSSNQDLFVTFEGTVKADTADGTIVKSKSDFWAEFQGGAKLPDNPRITSNEVQTEINKKRGDLVFVSAPKLLDFGQNLKISTKNQAYPIVSKDDNLVVEDHRGVGEKWSMNATLMKELTSDSGHQLLNSLHYKNQKQDYTFIVGNAIPIIEKETLDENAVDLSADWEGTKVGPFLDVQAGKPRAENYSGAIKWTLQDVPSNE